MIALLKTLLGKPVDTEVQDYISELREDIGRHCASGHVSRLIIAQLNYADRLWREGDRLAAMAVAQALRLGLAAAGPDILTEVSDD